MSYAFLELFRVSKGKNLKLKTIGDTVVYFRQQYMVEIAKFAYSCVVDGISLESTITKLGIAA